MTTLYSHKDENINKTYLLIGVFLALVIGVGYFFSYYFNNYTILLISVIFSIGMNIAGYWYSDTIALTMARAVPATGPQYLELNRTVENLSITAGLLTPKLYIINDPAPNAFATGRDSAHASVAVTTGLLQILDKTELEGVIAHELSHIGNRDILLQSMVAVLVGFIAILADMFTRGLFWGAGRRDNERNDAGGALMIVGIIFVVLSPIIAQLIQLSISRKREFLADASGALLTRYPEGLANALRKISSYEQPMTTASTATAHMYISNPFGAKAIKGAAKLFMTHPPVEERIQALLDTKNSDTYII